MARGRRACFDSAVQRAIRHALVSILATGLAACGMLPPQGDQPTSWALSPSAESSLVQAARASIPDASSSGFRLMPLGLYSLDARIELIRRARFTLDVQYYLIQGDRSGRLFMRSLRDAALRGVRVRVLVDDLYTGGADTLFAGLAAFPNAEVRLFNPFCCARDRGVAARFAASLFDFRRLNHRMHNKLFIADGAIAVMGGRNIADEYFARSAVSNFVDMDVLVAGDVVGPLEGIFDTYWNSPQAYPVTAIVGEPETRTVARDRFDHLVDDGDQMLFVSVPPIDMLAQRPLAAELDTGRLVLAVGTAVAFADQPGKVAATSEEIARSMTVQMNVMDRIARSGRRVVISSPYFVPGPAGFAALADLSGRGVQVVILTNSLATNDVPISHIGYARYRTGLLRAGVDLYELDPAGFRRRSWDAISGVSHGRLHAKVAVIDEAMVYIGSMNLDPRSETTNTELGISIRCPELARDVVRVIDAIRLQGSFRLRLASEGENVEWLMMRDPAAGALVREPETHPLLRLRNMLLGPFVPEQLL
ncbi:MAG TPA: phospholipase D family protein [Usitatibacter sp.]|nr:phospholipase D family protein [Usitatibacter sp.]